VAAPARSALAVLGLTGSTGVTVTGAQFVGSLPDCDCCVTVMEAWDV